MTVIIQVMHSDAFDFSRSSSTFVLSSLFEIEPFTIDISTENKMIFWIHDFVQKVKSAISYNEVTALKDFKPVFQVSTEFKCPVSGEVSNYKMESLLHHIYPLSEVQLRELSTDLFMALSSKWLGFYQECKTPRVEEVDK